MIVFGIQGRRYLLCLLVAFLASNSLWIANARGLPKQEGILNFGKISDALYRGAQPDAGGIKSLQSLGIKSIINLRMANDIWKEESSQATSHGILYTNVPLPGLGRPTDDQVRQLLSLIEGLPGPVFIHC